MISCEELLKIRNRAEEEAVIFGLSPRWQRAYLRLADAASILIAFKEQTIAFGEQTIDIEEK